jgi:hypothetical protein
MSDEIKGDARFYEIFGFDKEVSTNELVSIIHPEDLTVRETAYKESLTSGKLCYEARIIYKDKSLHWFKVYGKFFYNEDNLPIKLLGVVDDITAQKQMQKQKDNLLAIASHELKTPVTTIKAYGQLAESILESDGETVVLQVVKKIGTQVDKLAALIENLLNITKIQEGKLAYNETIFDFNEMAREVIEDMQVTCVTHLLVSAWPYSCGTRQFAFSFNKYFAELWLYSTGSRRRN